MDSRLIPNTEPPKKASASTDFLKGPIPWEWLLRANRSGGMSLIVGLALWRLRTMRQSQVISVSTRGLCQQIHSTVEKSVQRAVANLEKSKLIRVKREPGHKLSVEILTDRQLADPTAGIP